jgi:hypothetical protein
MKARMPNPGVPMRVALLPLFALLATPATADCPASRMDSAIGLRVAYADGSTVQYFRDQHGTVTETWAIPGGVPFRLTAHLGLAMLSITDLTAAGDPVPANEDRYTYDAALPEEPQAGDRWDSAFVIRGEGLPDERGRLTLSVEAAEPMAVGPCRYDRLAVRSLVELRGVQGAWQLDWLPALGITLPRETVANGDPAVTYLPVSIETVAD